MDDIAIKANGASKTFKLPHERQSSIKGSLISLLRGGDRSYEKLHALKGVSFEVKKGDFFGIVGRNGSGKSTLLKLLSGIYSPTEGDIQVMGKLTPFIELGVGFNPELTGRENVFLNGALLGFNRKEMLAMYNDIVAFAELKRFMDQKLKNYSSGMQVRLAFSIAIRANSDILLLDEVLAVGDSIFQQKCFDYFKELKKNKKTVILVSHDSNTLQQYCDRGILIESGKIIADGVIEDVVNKYKDILVEREETDISKIDKEEKRWGSREVEVVEAVISDPTGREQKIFTDKDTKIQIRVKYRAKTECDQPIYGITINDLTGQQLFASNTAWSHIKTPIMAKGASREIVWTIPNAFNTGSYTVNPAVANSTGVVMYDWRDNMVSFKIRKNLESTAQINVAHQITTDIGSRKDT